MMGCTWADCASINSLGLRHDCGGRDCVHTTRVPMLVVIVMTVPRFCAHTHLLADSVFQWLDSGVQMCSGHNHTHSLEAGIPFE